MQHAKARRPSLDLTKAGPTRVSKAGKLKNTREATPRRDATQYLLSVYSGQVCIGFLLSRRDGVEAYDADDRLLGTFPDQKSAADAISEAAR